MKTLRNSVYAVFLSLLTLSASADPITGAPVAGTGSTETVGIVSANGIISFYIPLDGEATYGVDGGTSSDSCYVPDCDGGSLVMTLFFDGATAGTNEIWALFEDLDVQGVNDPWYFLESLIVYAEDGTEIGIFSASDLAFGNRDFQGFSFNLDVEGSFYLTLLFSTDFHDYTRHGWYGNTREHLVAFAKSVPEPATLGMLGLGLIGAGFAMRRRKKIS